ANDLLPLIGTIIGVVGAAIGLQQKELPIIRLIMYLFIVAASIIQAVAVILLWSHMNNMLSMLHCVLCLATPRLLLVIVAVLHFGGQPAGSDCIEIECYQEVPFSSTQ